MKKIIENDELIDVEDDEPKASEDDSDDKSEEEPKDDAKSKDDEEVDIDEINRTTFIANSKHIKSKRNGRFKGHKSSCSLFRIS